MMDSNTGNTSQDARAIDDRDEDDDDEYEEARDGNRLLEFMFGNIDGSGDLDIDYLDEDAKEHLAALADKLGSSLTDIDLSVKASQRSVDTAEQDYDLKAEDAVDYEDIDEQYEGPEVQAFTEEDYLLPKSDFVSTTVPPVASSSLYDDDNYDDDEEEELQKELDRVDNNDHVQSTSLSGEVDNNLAVLSQGKYSPEDGSGAIEIENSDPDVVELQKYWLGIVISGLEVAAIKLKDDTIILEEPFEAKSSTPLPVLCVEDGNVILRFSEIFAIHEPLKKAVKREQWFSVPKEKYTAMDVSDIVEEDEEAFLKGSLEGFSYTRRAHVFQDDLLTLQEDKQELPKSRTVDADETGAPEVDDKRKGYFHDVMLLDGNTASDLSLDWNKTFCDDYFPLDQQDWENRIIFDNSPAVSETSGGSCEISGPEFEAIGSKEFHSLNGPLKSKTQLDLRADEEDNGHFCRSRPVSLEPFGSRKSPKSYSSSEEAIYHPQLLRLESRLEADDTDRLDGKKDGTVESDTIRRFNKLALRNKEVLNGSWMERVVWEPHQSVSKPKLLLDLQDEQMLFEVLDNKDSEHLQLHAGAMITTRSAESAGGDSLELHGYGGQSGGRFNIANDKFYSNRKSSQQLKSHSKKRAAHGVKVLHSIPALKLQTMKAKLSNKDIAYFHRPKALWYPHDNVVALKEQGKLLTRGSMKIVLKSLGGKGSKLHVDAEETILSVKGKATKKLDFKPSEPVKIIYSGKELEDQKSLAEQDVRPNSLLHLVRTRIHLLPRAQKLPGENKSLRPPGAFKKKSDLSARDGHVFLMEYCEERPLLLGNTGMGARLCTYYQKSNPGDQAGTLLRSGPNNLGNILTLDPADKSPFLGDIKAGSIQSCLETNMYRAPIYPHKVSSTDYLLIRSAKGKLSLRRIDRIYVVGQQEPHMEVMSPVSKGVQMYNMNRLLVFMYREFRALQKRGLVPAIRANELSAQFANVAEVSLRKRLKVFCDFQRGSYVMKRNFRVPLEEELRRMVTPENVCAFESMLAGMYRLKRLGISMTHPAGLSSAMNQLPDEAIALAAASHIERELQITPWNLSSNFVACTNQDRGNIERLEITGVGDPSGRGLGFSYVRTAPKAPVSNAVAKKKVAINRGGSTVTGTDADLRRLSMEAAREVLVKFNVPEEQIAKLTRWHRIAMIRKLSSEQAASGVKVDPTTISKYARGQRMSFLQLQQQTREKCQEIWDRQVQNLSAIDGEENESDTEANSDLDSFAGDLENLLDAEECDEGEEGNYESNNENLVGVKGLKMRRLPSQAQAEVENEDEAAEAAELCRMLMDGLTFKFQVCLLWNSICFVLIGLNGIWDHTADDEAERKKKKVKSVGGDMGLTALQQLNHNSKNKERLKAINSNLKPMSGITRPDGSFSINENAVKSLKDDELFPYRKNFSGKMKPKKKDDLEQVGGLLNKKLRILNDGMNIMKVGNTKKNARESFACGACGQYGHMKTNKHCPKYRENSSIQVESKDPEKGSAKSISLDPVAKPQPKNTVKKLIQKGGTKLAVVEAPPEEEKSSLKAKVLKVKCGPANSKIQEKATPSTSQVSDRPTKADDVQVESHKPSSLVIRPPVESSRNLPRKTIVIKRPKEVFDLDQGSQEVSPGLEPRKTKRITELSGFQKHRDHEEHFVERVRSNRAKDNSNQFWEDEQTLRIAERQREERDRLLYEEQQARKLEEQERVAEIRRFEEDIKREREEERRQREKKKKKKNIHFETRNDFLEDTRPRRDDRRIPERDRTAKRKPVIELGGRFGAEYTPTVKRRRGGEVGLANILEKIIDTLKANEVSFLFLKPVTRKEAPDYLKIINRPMDLSTMREKVRRLEYKSRDAFRHDMWQITFNAHKYNDGRNPGIPPLADQLLELCDFLLSEYDAILAEAEADIEE
ncbi:transcription initiation factor TFIID subunit 1 isoform X3 [Cynara cardunculus var. scolymus]|uniref:transcription initiation factor TFIID subunit 1 isoform X3 n=1 Tax=Cynara cardunculus var. scolymus TaxID=59895 RepID=UPI000D629324|nr:transcription initiation factor TFIID subunit 1 isoform X3 [Cynara cardunculus var. scolymus]